QTDSSTNPARKSGTDSDSGTQAKGENLNPPNMRPPNDQLDTQRGSVKGATQQDPNGGASGTTPDNQQPAAAERQNGRGGRTSESKGAAKKTVAPNSQRPSPSREAVGKPDAPKAKEKDTKPEKHAAEEKAKPEKYPKPEPKAQPKPQEQPPQP